MWCSFPSSTSDEEPTCQRRRHIIHGFDPWVRKIPWGGHDNPLQYFCLENPMNRGAWRATVYSVAKSQTQLKQISTHTHTVYCERCGCGIRKWVRKVLYSGERSWQPDLTAIAALGKEGAHRRKLLWRCYEENSQGLHSAYHAPGTV